MALIGDETHIRVDGKIAKHTAVEAALKKIAPDWAQSEMARKIIPDCVAELKKQHYSRKKESAAKALGEIGDETVVGILIDYFRSADSTCAVSSLELILERAATKVEVNHLQTLAHLPSVEKEIWGSEPAVLGVRADFGSQGVPTRGIYRGTWRVDCSRINLLAREELMRRGLKPEPPT